MTATTRPAIDLAFSLVQPSSARAADSPAADSAQPTADVEGMSGTVKAAGLDVEITAKRPNCSFQGGQAEGPSQHREDLAERGLTVPLNGPNWSHRSRWRRPPRRRSSECDGSADILLGSRAALAPLLRRRSRRRRAAPPTTIPLPPPTLFPLIPTLDRRIRRRITTTHYTPGSGRPRLLFVVGSENWNGQAPREFDLLPEVTTIGSGPESDLQLDGLRLLHAQIIHDENDEYVLLPIGPVAGGTKQEAGVRQILRTGARIEMGQWRMAFFREEFADHGRPYGGRLGGELSVQKPQPSRRNARPERAPGTTRQVVARAQLGRIAPHTLTPADHWTTPKSRGRRAPCAPFGSLRML